MIITCRKCGNDNELPDDVCDCGYEGYECGHCLATAFIPDRGLFIYMARTSDTEPKAYEALAKNEEVFIWNIY